VNGEFFANWLAAGGPNLEIARAVHKIPGPIGGPGSCGERSNWDISLGKIIKAIA